MLTGVETVRNDAMHRQESGIINGRGNGNETIFNSSAEGCVQKGDVLRSEEHYQEAIAVYDRVIDFERYFAATWHNKGCALNVLGRYEEAVEAQKIWQALKQASLS